MRQKTCCASERNTSVRVVFANRSGFDSPIGIFMAWKEHGSCLNIFRTANRSRISETFTNYEAKHLLRKNLHELRGKGLVAQERGLDLNIFWMRNRGRISETFTNYEAKDLLSKNRHELRGKRLVAQVSETRRFVLYLRTGVVLILQLESSWYGRTVHHVLTYSGRKIAVGSQKPSRVTRQNTCCARAMAWEQRGSCLNIFRKTNRGRISETFSNYKAKDMLRKWSVDHALTYSRRKITFGPQKSSRITRQKTCCAIVMAWEKRGSCLNIFRKRNRGRISETFTNYKANPSGFDAGIGVFMAWEERGSCLNIFRTKNHGQVLETFMNYEAKDLSRKIGVVMAWEERGSCLNIFRTTNHGRVSETFTNYEAKDLLRNTSVRVVFAKPSGFDARIGVLMAWAEHGSCLNIFRMRDRGRISETFTNYEAKDLLRYLVDLMLELESSWYGKTVDHVLTYSGRKNRGRNSESLTNYEAKAFLRKNVHKLRGKRIVAQVTKTRRFALILRSRVDLMLELESSWHGRSVDHVLTYSRHEIMDGSQKP
ncbi:uncharacterized protein G2W53_026476 [Senna tora]|uniref:Uncharacterized protein n=1 Tax=Senna tora TaxID=362788 RepID=A0A834TH89_9FABA|nr:uncharacterized protein G2W53_026476 [Senna tora]